MKFLPPLLLIPLLICSPLFLTNCSDPSICGWTSEPAVPFYNATGTSVKVVRDVLGTKDSFLIRAWDTVGIPIDMNADHIDLSWFHLGERAPVRIYYELDVDRDRDDPLLYFTKINVESSRWLRYFSFNGFFGEEINTSSRIHEIVNCKHDEPITFVR